MAITLHELESEWGSREVKDGEVITRAWQIRHGETITTAGQERGDVVLGTTYYEVLSSYTTHVQGKMQQKLKVTGFRSDLWSGVARSDTFRELLRSRLLQKSRNGLVYVRRWECDDAVIQEDEKGWGSVTDSVATGVTQSGYVLTSTGGSVFYPSMIGLPVTLAVAGDTSVNCVGYTSPTVITLAETQTVGTPTTATFRGPLPAEVGDAIGTGKWTNQIQPGCMKVSVDPSFTVKRTLITAQYGAPRRR
jgi:hypothetical protein